MNKKLIKTMILILLFIFVLVGCGEEVTKEEPCAHESCTWVWEEDAKCNRNNLMFKTCDKCGMQLDMKEEFKEHEYYDETVEATCTEKGYTLTKCKNCNTTTKKVLDALGHNYETVIDREATSELYGLKHKECSRCESKTAQVEYVNNGFSSHGALHVTGVNLMDSNNKQMRLVGLSTHGLQWAGQYVNFDTFEALKNEFGINVIRLSLYPGEGGYLTGGEEKKASLYETVQNGIKYATELDMYVIIDWHMLTDDAVPGAENPLYYKTEAVAFFEKITKEFKNYQNLLFEIMNEPSGDSTWADCKTYAKAVIPAIRKNMPDAVILVGNPQWSSDLASVAKDKLTYPNIMYTFHFYAADNDYTNKITTAIGTNKLPVFVTEHGGMDADGDGAINTKNLKKWYEVLDKYNISFVAWNLSNTKGSASIFKTTTKTLDDFSDELLKEWGIVYKNRCREIVGLSVNQ